MSFWERVVTMLGYHRDDPEDEARVILDRAEQNQAERLSKLIGKRRDEVFAESYRLGDKRRREALRVEVNSMRRR